jgi:hypothetical protein
LTSDFWAVFEEKSCKGKKRKQIARVAMRKATTETKADPPPAAKDDN